MAVTGELHGLNLLCYGLNSKSFAFIGYKPTFLLFTVFWKYFKPTVELQEQCKELFCMFCPDSRVFNIWHMLCQFCFSLNHRRLGCIYITTFNTLVYFLFFFFFFSFLEAGWAEEERESQAGQAPRGAHHRPDVGLNLRPIKSWPELKSSLINRWLTHWATQVPYFSVVFF